MVRCLRCNVKEEAFSDFIERRDYTLTSVPWVIFNPICVHPFLLCFEINTAESVLYTRNTVVLL